MSLIKTRILSSQYEIIRDRIGFILADEFETQKSFGDTDIAQLKIWVSRSVAFDKNEMPAINVNFVHGDYYSKDVSADTNIYKFAIDVHAGGKTGADGRGDAKAAMIAQKIMGIAQRILMDSQYQLLGFNPPSVQTRYIETADVAEVVRNDADSLQFVRFIFCVRVNEGVNLLDANLIKSYNTNVRLDLTNEGYVFTVIAY